MKIKQKIENWVLGKISSRFYTNVDGSFSYSGGISHNADQAEMLKAYQGWVYACASIIARNVAKVPLRLYQQLQKKMEIEDHVLLELLQNINPIHTQYELWELTVTWLELTGNSYWYLPKNRLNVPGEIWPVPPDRMWVVPDKQEIIKGYLYRYQGKQIAFDRDEIVHLRYPDPNNIYYGCSPLKAAAYSYDIDLYMKKYSLNLFKNDGRPKGVLETDQTLDEPTTDRLRHAWHRTYGGIENQGKIAILQAGAKYKNVQVSPSELDFMASRKLTRDDILAIFGVPGSKLGLVEDVNRANAEANDYTFQSEVISPRLKLIGSKLNKDLTPKYDLKLSLQFDDPVPKNRVLLLKERETNLKNYVTTINEEREALGKKPAKWGDAPWMPFNLVQAGSGIETPSDRQIKQYGFPGLKRDAEKVKEAQWRSYIALHYPAERSFRRDVRKLFGRQKAEVLDNLKKVFNEKSLVRNAAQIESILFGRNDWERIFSEEMGANYQDMLLGAAEKAISDLGVDSTFDFKNPRVARFLREKKYKFSFQVNDTTIKSLRGELTEAFANDEAMEAFAERIDKVFGFADQYRSLRIARTEATSTTNFGIFESYNQLGIVTGKTWLSARDEHTRESHQVLDGITVGLDDYFETRSGILLKYPGDPDADIAEIINCRCTELPVIEGS